jgi:hypothetical protein
LVALVTDELEARARLPSSNSRTPTAVAWRYGSEDVRRAAVVSAGLLAFVVAATTSASANVPDLLSAAASKGHVVAVFDLGAAGDLAPVQIAVASAPAAEPSGAFVPANVRLAERIGGGVAVPGGDRVRTRHALPPGRYWVKVSARPLGIDCLPLKPCREDWSNAQPVVVAHRSE